MRLHRVRAGHSNLKSLRGAAVMLAAAAQESLAERKTMGDEELDISQIRVVVLGLGLNF